MRIPSEVHQVGGTRVSVYTGESRVETTLPGGASVPAEPMHDPESLARAHALGYGGDVWEMTRDHDKLHSVLCHALGLPESPTLRRVTQGLEPSELSNAEEHLVLAAQRFLNLCRKEGLEQREQEAA